MVKGRSGLVVFLILVLLAIVVFLVARRPGGFTRVLNRQQPTLPLDLQRVIPAEWTVLPAQSFQCSFDEDADLEWLVVYRYDNVVITPPSERAENGVAVAPYGAVIYDVRQDFLPERPERPGPYRPTELVPYKLLPDFYAGKGQGYLGETSVEVFTVPVVTRGTGCHADEINVVGFGNAGLPTHLSIFRWGSPASGYRSAHLTGNARIATDARADSGTPINLVTTYNRVENHRSLLCEVENFERLGLPAALAFEPVPGSKTIDFCYGAPADPFYPEAVVVALLRKNVPLAGAANVPPLDSYLLSNATVPAELDLRSPGRQPVAILRARNPSSIEPAQDQGAWCTPEQIPGVPPESWWCGRERTMVEADVLLNGAPRTTAWTLTSVIPAMVSSNVHWRVEQVVLQ